MRMRQQRTIASVLAFVAFLPAPTLARETHAANDEFFVRQTLRVNLLNDTLAKTFLERDRVSYARTVAQKVLAQDKVSEQSLQSAARASGLAPPKERAIAAKPPRSALSYLEQNVEHQRTALHLFREEARHGDKAPLRAYAQTRLPLIRNDLIDAEREERRTAGTPTDARPGYVLPKPWPSITPMGRGPSTIPPEPEGRVPSRKRGEEASASANLLPVF
jgi:predicted outer membrane protein